MVSISFWSGKRVCVTGGAGFLGGFVLEELRSLGAEHVGDTSTLNDNPRRKALDPIRRDPIRGL